MIRVLRKTSRRGLEIMYKYIILERIDQTYQSLKTFTVTGINVNQACRANVTLMSGIQESVCVHYVDVKSESNFTKTDVMCNVTQYPFPPPQSFFLKLKF